MGTRINYVFGVPPTLVLFSNSHHVSEDPETIFRAIVEKHGDYVPHGPMLCELLTATYQTDSGQHRRGDPVFSLDQSPGDRERILTVVFRSGRLVINSENVLARPMYPHDGMVPASVAIPWAVARGGTAYYPLDVVCGSTVIASFHSWQGDRPENALRIVRAVNAHGQLVRALHDIALPALAALAQCGASRGAREAAAAQAELLRDLLAPLLQPLPLEDVAHC